MSRWRLDRGRGRNQRPMLLGVSGEGVAWLAPAASPPAWQTWDWPACEDSPSAFIDWLKNHSPESGCSGRPVQLCLSPDIARHWLQPVPSGTASLSELHAVAMATAQQLWGEGSVEAWSVMGDWRSGGAFLCTAVPAAWERVWAELRARWGELSIHTPLLLALRHGLSGARLTSHSLSGPRWPRHGWVGFALAHHLFVLRLQDAQVASLRCVQIPHAAGCASLEKAVLQEARREMLRYGGQQEPVHYPRAFAQPDLPQDSSAAAHAAWCAFHFSEEGRHAV